MKTFNIFINNRDRLTYTKELADQCSLLQMVGDIFIVDNDSSYPPLLEWYENCPYQVVKLGKNLGPRAPWTIPGMADDFYVVTDNDLDIGNVPKHVLDMLFDGLQKHPEIIKAGLSLENEDIPDAYHLKSLVLERETGMWSPCLKDPRFCEAAIDTTFAMYRPHNGWGGYTPALRARRPYTAKHRPWYATQLNEEDRYYLEHLSTEGIIYSAISQVKGVHKEQEEERSKEVYIPLAAEKEETLMERYSRLVKEPSDINEHLGILSSLAQQCVHVTEFGTRGGISTTALFYGLFMTREPTLTKLVCYDKNHCDCAELFNKWSKRPHFPSFRMNKANTAKDLEIKETDMLFIDTWHVYDQLKAELVLHSNKVRKWIVLHDTKTFGEHGEGGGEGLWKAVEEFLELGTFQIEEKHDNQNGLTVLARKNKSK